MKIRIQQQLWYNGLSVGIFNDDSFVESMTIRKKEPVIIIKSAFEIDYTEAQILMDDLWNCGIRPSEGSGSAGQLTAIQNHLEDMRTIVSKSLDIKL